MANRKRNSHKDPGRARLRLPLMGRRMLWGLVALTLGALALAGLARLLDQPIQRVIVTGRLQHVSPLDVEKVVRAHLGAAGFVTVNLEEISQGLTTLPWVDMAAVQRSWPRGLKIQITEQSAVARWNGTGLVNARGVLFISDARFTPPELPQLAGPMGTAQEVTTHYLAMQGRLTEVGLRLTTLTLDARGAWNFTLDDGVLVRLGRQQLDERFDRFMLAAAKLVRSRAADIAYVDMRYGNGFAVGWKGGAGHVAITGEAAHLNG